MPPDLTARVLATLSKLPVADVHTHLGGKGQRVAGNLADLVGYHWIMYELNRAGADVNEGDERSDARGYMETVVPHFDAIRNTSNHFVLMSMLHDLYGFTGRTLTADNWRALDAKVRARADDPSWLSAVLDRAGIAKLPVPYRDGMPDDSSRFVPYEYGEALFAPSSLRRLRHIAGPDSPLPQTPEVLRAVINGRIGMLRKEHGVRILHVWMRDSWSYRRCHEGDARDFLVRLLSSRSLSPEQDDMLVSYCADATAEAAAEHGMTLQLFNGMDYYFHDSPRSVCSFWNPDFLRSMPRFADAHPRTSIELFLGTRIPSHEAASLSRSCRNWSISGAWWHGFTPATLSEFFKDRLELLPNTAWNAYFSDGYTVEWIYAKRLLTLRCLARAMAQSIEEGLLVEEDVPEIGRRLLHDNAQRIYAW